jgi:hypothetical protein
MFYSSIVSLSFHVFIQIHLNAQFDTNKLMQTWSYKEPAWLEMRWLGLAGSQHYLLDFRFNSKHQHCQGGDSENARIQECCLF